MSEEKHVATINGVDYELMDDEGTLRFRVNGPIRKLVDVGIEQRDRGGYDLNTMWMDFHRGVYTIDEMMELYRLMGYSLWGYWEVFGWSWNTESKGMEEPVKIYLDGEPYPDEDFGNGDE